MPITTLPSRKFQQNASEAQKAAQDGPVVITYRGRPAHVLMSYEDYRRLTGPRNIVDALSMPGLANIDVEFPRLKMIARPVELS